MPQIRRDESVAAATATNIMSGELGERLARPARVRVYSAIRTSSAFDVRATVIIGDRTIGRNLKLPNNASGVVIPDHQVAAGEGLPGEQVFVEIENQNATTARDVSSVIDIEYVA